MQHLREIGVGVFAYSGLALIEGIGLMLEKVWAEYLTLSLTIAFLPWELWELAHGVERRSGLAIAAGEPGGAGLSFMAAESEEED